jgi:hypothetical protein
MNSAIRLESKVKSAHVISFLISLHATCVADVAILHLHGGFQLCSAFDNVKGDLTLLAARIAKNFHLSLRFEIYSDGSR